MRKRRLLFSLILIAVALWCALLFAPPVAVRTGGEGAEWGSMAALPFSMVCHRIPERCFWLWGVPLAACSRCTGLFVGFLGGTAFFPLVARRFPGRFPKARLFGVAAAPLCLDFGLSHLGIVESSNWIRGLTGLVFGLVLPLYLVPGILDAVLNHRDRRG